MKTKTVSPITKFLHWQYSGLIVVPTAVILILIWWFSATGDMEFYDYWSCNTLADYVDGIDLPDDIPKHDELTQEQHTHLHDLLVECQDNNRFFAPLKHLEQ